MIPTLRNLHMNWEAVIVRHVNIATSQTRHDVRSFDSLRWNPYAPPNLSLIIESDYEDCKQKFT